MTQQLTAATDVVDVTATPVPSSKEIVETPEVGESRLPAKNTRDFSVEFLQGDKRKLLPKSSNVGAYVTAMRFSQKSVESIQVKKKKRKPQQAEMPWIVAMTLVDDPNNEVQDFLDSLKESGDEFRIRVNATDASGSALEAFVLKDVTVTRYPDDFMFDIEMDQDRVLRVEFQASTCIRKSKVTADGE